MASNLISGNVSVSRIVTTSVVAKGEAGQSTDQYNRTNSKETPKPAYDWVAFLNSISTTVVAVFTVLVVIVYWKQLRTTRTAERAWVVADAPTVTLRPENHIVELSWPLLNNGRTPAWVPELGSAGKIVKTGEELPEKPPYTMAVPFPREGTVLTPGGRILRGLTVTEAQMAQVERGQGTLYVFGIANYRDIFGGKHETRYCYRFKAGPTNTDPAPRDFYVDGPPAYIKAT